jgi:Transposase DDE domain
LARRLIGQARRLYVNEDLGFDLANTVYALDSTTIDLCLAVFPWAHFRTTKAAVTMHTLLDLRGNIPSFIHVSDGKRHDVHALDLLLPEAGAIYVMDRGYVDFARLHVLHLAGAFFVTRAKSNIDAHRVYSAPTDRTAGIVCDQTIALDGHYTSQHYPEHLRRIRLRDTETRRTLVFLTNQFGLPAATICALYKSRWQVERHRQLVWVEATGAGGRRLAMFIRNFIGNPCCRFQPIPEISGFWKLCARQQ